MKYDIVIIGAGPAGLYLAGLLGKSKKILLIESGHEGFSESANDLLSGFSYENQKDNVKFGQSDDPVLDKTFKIRLTSKKTGKKIDINLTHKLV